MVEIIIADSTFCLSNDSRRRSAEEDKNFFYSGRGMYICILLKAFELIKKQNVGSHRDS